MPSKNRLTDYLNSSNYLLWERYLWELNFLCFEWLNLPDSINEEFMEKTLSRVGYSIFYKDVGLDAFLCLGGHLQPPYDVYGIPSRRIARGANTAYKYYLNYEDSIIIWNNALHTSDQNLVRSYARKLYNMDRIQDVNVENQKTPSLIIADEKMKIAAKNYSKERHDNEPEIYLYKNFDPNMVQHYALNAPYVAGDIELLKHQIINEYLTIKGYENSNQDKRERLVAAEAEGNTGQTEAGRAIGLRSRKYAAKMINKMFNLDVDVRFRSDLPTNLNMPELAKPNVSTINYQYTGSIQKED